MNIEGKVSKNQEKSSCFTAGAHSGGYHSDMDLILQRERGNNKGCVFEGKTPTLSACSWEQNNLLSTSRCIRRLTPVECSRLQTVPSWYRWKCSDTQIYKMIGNGWTVDVIVHILSFIKEKLNINVA